MAKIVNFLIDKGFWYSIAGSFFMDGLKNFFESYSDLISTISTGCFIIACFIGLCILFDKYLLVHFKELFTPRKRENNLLIKEGYETQIAKLEAENAAQKEVIEKISSLETQIARIETANDAVQKEVIEKISSLETQIAKVKAESEIHKGIIIETVKPEFFNRYSEKPSDSDDFIAW